MIDAAAQPVLSISTNCLTDLVVGPEATKKGYAEAYEGDGVYINRPHQKRGCVQKGLNQTLKTSCDDVGVGVKVGNYSPSGHNAASIVDSQGIAPTVMNNHGTITAIAEEPYYSDYSMKKIQENIITEDVCGTITASAMQSITHNNCHLVVEDTPQLVGDIGEKKSNGGSQFYQQDRIYDSNAIAMCHPANLPSGSYMYQMNNLAIRKLTPKEVWRLMGVKDDDFENVSKNQSDSSLYHLAGDSIVTTCLMAIFGELLGIDWKEKFNYKEWWQ